MQNPERQNEDIKNARPFSLDNKYYVVQSNSLIRAKQELTVLESRILSICISQNMKTDTEFRTYKVRVIDLADFLKVNVKRLYRDLPGMCETLMRRIIQIKSADSEKWEIFHWVSYVSYNDGELSIRLSEELKPFLLSLESYYTQFQLQTILSFQSIYTIRLYQNLKCDVGQSQGQRDHWCFSIDEMRDMFQTGSKYVNARDLIKNTMNVAIAELQESPYALFLNIKEKRSRKRGNPLEGIEFDVVLFDNGTHKQRYLEYIGIVIKDKNGKPIRFDDDSSSVFKETSNDTLNLAGRANKDAEMEGGAQLRLF